ncbi:MAG: hypothetical protein COS89_00930 [Deltaproteobacteria bacterium CG07_land_8_20_14_0_80_38_7]|nr:MAG: hypothetical protein COS89_00930 [Deltaproteobacteria bacterium CG07_land_8_20_14_0_80_38_7]
MIRRNLREACLRCPGLGRIRRMAEANRNRQGFLSFGMEIEAHRSFKEVNGMKRLYRVDEVGEMLSVSTKTVRRLISRGELIGHNDSPGRRGLRVTVESLEKYIERYKGNPGSFE